MEPIDHLAEAEALLSTSHMDMYTTETEWLQALALMSIAASLIEIGQSLALIVDRQGYVPGTHGGEH